MPMGKAVWYIENHLGEPLSLDAIAQSCGLSKFHFARAFGTATGMSVMGYVRARRLSEAARVLAAGKPDILMVALDAGYGSHPAFTRAFRDRFGTTPERVRGNGGTDHLKLTEPFKMTMNPGMRVEPDRFQDRPAMRFAGMSQHYKFSEIPQIPTLWQKFGPHIGHVPGQAPDGAWGVNYSDPPVEDGFDYMAAVEVAADADVGPDLETRAIPALHYAVFIHDRHVSEMNATMRAIFDWVAKSDYEPAEPGLILERYTEEFDGETGLGGMEIWLPVKR